MCAPCTLSDQSTPEQTVEVFCTQSPTQLSLHDEVDSDDAPHPWALIRPHWLDDDFGSHASDDANPITQVIDQEDPAKRMYARNLFKPTINALRIFTRFCLN